jgi:ribosome-associated protein
MIGAKGEAAPTLPGAATPRQRVYLGRGNRARETMYGELYVDRSVTIPAGELSWRFSHSGGPGGQGVNTSDSKVELRFHLGETRAIPEHLKARALSRLESRLVDGALVVTSSAHRAQLDNRKAAATKLAVMLRNAMAPAPPQRRPTKPSKGSVARRLDAKTRHGSLKKQRRNLDD